MIHNEDGFSLTELMVVIVVIGILAMISIPKFMNVATKAKMTEAKTKLRHVSALQKAYHFEHDRFTAELEQLGFDVSGGESRYEIHVTEADANSFRAVATATVDFDGDGVYNQWVVTQDGVVEQLVAD